MTAVGFPLGEHGRLGNSLFQLAATIGVARSRDLSIMVDEDWPYIPFLSLPEEWIGKGRYVDTRSYVGGNHWRRTYMQDPSLWSDVADEVAVAFSPSARAQAVLASLPEPSPDDVAVHVRRGDYLTMPEHLPALSESYYERAFLAQIESGFRAFAIFSDDPAWCQGRFGVWPVVSSDGMPTSEGEPTDWLDLFRMARYRNLVIANSSYSWWAAFLAGPDAFVCCPSPWFGPKIDVASPALPEWIEVAA